MELGGAGPRVVLAWHTPSLDIAAGNTVATGSTQPQPQVSHAMIEIVRPYDLHLTVLLYCACVLRDRADGGQEHGVRKGGRRRFVG